MFRIPTYAFLLFSLSLAPASALSAMMITLEVQTDPLITMRMERVLSRYNYKLAHKNSNSRRTELVLTNDRDNHVPANMIIDLGFHSTFIGIKAPAAKVENVQLKIYLQNSIAREKYVELLIELQTMGIHVSKATSQRDPHFFVDVPRDKMDSLTETLRKSPLFDLYFVFGSSPSTEFFQDYKRNGVTSVEIAFAKAGTHESILAKIPAHIAAVSVMSHQTAAELKSEKEQAPEGGITTITLPRKYAYVGAMIRSLEQYRGERLIKIFPGDDYYEAQGDDKEAFIIDPSSRRFVLEPRSLRIIEVAKKLPELKELVEDAQSKFDVPLEVAIFYAGLAALVQKAYQLPIDIYGHAKGTNNQGGMTEFIYLEIPKDSMTPQLLEKLLTDYHLYPLHNDGTPNRNEEVLRIGHASCDGLLTPKP